MVPQRGMHLCMVPNENNPKTPNPRRKRTQIKTATNREKGAFSVCLRGLGNAFGVTADIRRNIY